MKLASFPTYAYAHVHTCHCIALKAILSVFSLPYWLLDFGVDMHESQGGYYG